MQTLQASRANSYAGRTASSSSRWSLDDGRSIQSPQSVAISYNTRNRQLASMLDKSMSELRRCMNTKSEHKDTYIKAIELAVAKVEFVKVYLEDSTMPLPQEPAESKTESQSTLVESGRGQRPQSPNVVATTAQQNDILPLPATVNTSSSPAEPTAASPTKNTSDLQSGTSIPANLPAVVVSSDKTSGADDPLSSKNAIPRPAAPLPTRSSIAQSNFAWMLEPGESSSPVSTSPPQSSSPFLKSARKPTSGASREKAAFLFGEENDDILDRKSPRRPADKDADQIFSLGTIKGRKDGV